MPELNESRPYVVNTSWSGRGVSAQRMNIPEPRQQCACEGLVLAMLCPEALEFAPGTEPDDMPLHVIAAFVKARHILWQQCSDANRDCPWGGLYAGA